MGISEIGASESKLSRTKTTTKSAATIDSVELLPVRTPVLNLHDLEAVRREMARVYRDMRSARIDTQVGSRLIYSLSQIGKLIEVATIERRIEALENPIKRLAQPNEVDDVEVRNG